MLEKFQKHIKSNFPELYSDSIAVAISGGKDSTVLAYLLEQSELKFDLIHCNFNLRGAESDDDQQFVEELAKQFNCKLHVRCFETEEFALKKGISIQMAARELRYDAFNEIAVVNNYDSILVAHHLEDQLETFLINLGRGAGLHGLRGIRSRNGKIIRPLLPFSREELDHFASDNQINWREDSSNSSTKYQRNKLRHDVVPLLYDALPHLKNNFSDTLSHLNDSELLIDVEVARFRESGTKLYKETLEIDIALLKATSQPKIYLFELLREHNFHIPDALSLLDAENGKYIVSDNMRLLKDREVLVLSQINPEEDIDLEINNLNGLIKIGKEILEVKKLEVTDALEYLQTNLAENKLFLDSEKLQLPLLLRKWQNGDRMQPYGMKGSKLISDLLTDSKISYLKREKALVLISGRNIIWLVGKRTSKYHQITSTTKTIIEITLKL